MDKKEVRRTPKFIQYAMKTAMEAIWACRAGRGGNKQGQGGRNRGLRHQRLERHGGAADRVAAERPVARFPFLIPMLIPNMAGAFISMKYGYRGPNFCIVTACASSTHCIGEAAKVIQRGDADVAIAEPKGRLPAGLAGFCSAKSLSTRNDDPEHACRPFDIDRDGFVMADGSGMMVLESLEHAEKRGARIIAEFAGYGSSDDAFHMTAPSANGVGGALAIKSALSDAGIKPEQMDYINAHGTSTLLNNEEETSGIKLVFGGHAKKLAMSLDKYRHST